MVTNLSDEADVGLRRMPTQARSKENIERILDALIELYEQGISDISPKLLAETSGVSTATLYRFFPNIEAAAVACARRYLDSQDVELAEILSNGADRHWRDVNRSMIQAIVGQIIEDKTQRDILRQIYYSGAFQKANLPHREAFIQVFRQALEERQLFVPNTDVDVIARSLVEISAAFQKMVLFADTQSDAERFMNEWVTVTEGYVRSKL